jgi:hypothetical protein
LLWRATPIALLVLAAAALAIIAPNVALAFALLAGTVAASVSLKKEEQSPAVFGAMAALCLYVPSGLGSIDLPLLVPVTVLVAAALLTSERSMIRSSSWWWMIPVVTAVVGLLVGVLRGPAGALGLRPIASICWLLVVAWVASRFQRDNRIDAALRSYSAIAAVFGLVNFLFFVVPTLEDKYFAGWISQVFVEPDSVRYLLTGDVLNNALSHDKAATLYINANAAAMFFGTAAWVGYGWWPRGIVRTVIVLACSIGALGTASRGGAVGALAGFAAWGLLQLHARSLLRVVGRLAVSLAVLVVLGAVLVGMREGGFARFSWDVVSADPRLVLWGAAIRLATVHPIIGSGFGAWETFWPPIAQVVNLRPSFPPHNVYLHLWIVGGFLSVLGFLTLGVAGLFRIRSLTVENTRVDTSQLLASGAIIGWLWTQANFENLFFLDYRLGFLMAAVLGGLAARNTRSQTA